MNWLRRAAVLAVGCFTAAAQAAPFDYKLQPVTVATGVYAFIGKIENFSRDNGGSIVNTGFIVGTDGVIVIDSGPSKAYGEQQRAAIAKVTTLPVVQVFLSQAHPDHFLGNQAYVGVPIAATPATNTAIRLFGDGLLDNLYRLVGGAMSGTQLQLPTAEAKTGSVIVGARKLSLIAAVGHTDGDLMVFDEATKTLFTGDLVFFQRTLSTPNADIPRWLATLDEIDTLDFRILVPGHGPVQSDHVGVAQTRDYLRWLSGTLKDAANRGLDMPEVMRLPIPERFQKLAVLQSEFTRSVTHLYPAYELESLPAAPK